MARRTNDKIRKENLILCEGRDAEEFLIAYLNSDALAEIPAFSNDFQVMEFGGNEQLAEYMQILKNMEGFKNVKSIAIIRDAEKNVSRAVLQIQEALRKNDFPVPKESCSWEGEELKIGFALFPTCSTEMVTGALEDLCLSILAEDNNEVILKEIDDFIINLEEKHNRKFPHEFKTKLHSYFAVTDDFVAMKIGEAARANAFNWECDRLAVLKSFLAQIT